MEKATLDVPQPMGRRDNGTEAVRCRQHAAGLAAPVGMTRDHGDAGHGWMQDNSWHTKGDTAAQLQQTWWTDSREVFRDSGGAECTQEALELEDWLLTTVRSHHCGCRAGG
jgi:hypothetical protein